MKINKKIAAGIMSVVAMAISVTGISASATSEYYDAYTNIKTEGGYSYYQGVGVADGSTFKVISGYMSTSGGSIYATGTNKYKSTGWAHSYASGGTGQFTFSFERSNFTVSY